MKLSSYSQQSLVDNENPNEIKLYVYPFGGEKLGKRIAELIDHKNGIESIIEEKEHFRYLEEYLVGIGAKTILVESSYLDRDLISDLWAFMPDNANVRKHDCIRLHFFKKTFAQQSKINRGMEISWDKLDSYLNTTTKAEDYLGFMVVMRSGDKIVGPTCLKAKSTEETKNRLIPTLREYKVNLVGHKLTVNSLGFREQDEVTSACATCAIWSVLQKSSVKYGHSALSPGEITARALDVPYPGHKLPEKKGLSANAMESIIESIPEIRAFTYPTKSSQDEQKRFMATALKFMLPFLDFGIPIIIIMKKEENTRHAVVVVGYNYVRTSERDQQNKSKADRITSLIVHDDNIGPFIPYDIDKENDLIVAPAKYGRKKTEWKFHSIICVAHKSIKIYPHIEIKKFMIDYNRMLAAWGLYSLRRRYAMNNYNVYFSIRSAIWSIKIWKSNEYKRAICRAVSDNNKDYEELDLYDVQISLKVRSRLITLLQNNLPEYIVVLSMRNGFEHDIVFSLAGPWKTQMFIIMVPFSEELLKFFSHIKKSALGLNFLKSFSPNCMQAATYIKILTESTKLRRKFP